MWCVSNQYFLNQNQLENSKVVIAHKRKIVDTSKSHIIIAIISIYIIIMRNTSIINIINYSSHSEFCAQNILEQAMSEEGIFFSL